MVQVCEEGLQAFTGVEETAHDGAEGATGGVGDFLIGEPVDFLHEDDGAVFRGEFGEGVADAEAEFLVFEGLVGVLDPVGDGDCSGFRGGGGGVIEFGGGVAAADAFTAEPVAGGVVGDAVEPCGELGAFFEAWEGTPRLDEDLLGEVPCIGFVASHVVDHGVDAGAVADHERLEGS